MVDIDVGGIDAGGMVIIAGAERHDRASPEVPLSSLRPNLSLKYRVTA